MEQDSDSSTLFVADLPDFFTEEALIALFQEYPGFKSARMRRDRKDNLIGFIDFDEADACEAPLNALMNFTPAGASDPISVSRARSKPRGGAPRQFPGEPGDRSPSQAKFRGAPRNGVPFSGFAGAYGILPPPFQQQFYPAQAPTPDASSTLYVEGLPMDASEREVSHIFRPFPGLVGLRITPKDSKTHPGEKYLLCFVEFESPIQASLAMQTLQGYKMDRNDVRGLTISFARSSRERSRNEKNIQSRGTAPLT